VTRLGGRVGHVAGLVRREPSALAAEQDAAERKFKAATCVPCLRQHSPIDLAVAALLLSADEGPDDHVTRKQLHEALPSRLVSRPSLGTSLSLLEKVLRLGPSYFFIPLVLGPLNSLVWYVPSLRYTRGLGWRMHCGAEVTESSTNKQHHLSTPLKQCTTSRSRLQKGFIGPMPHGPICALLLCACAFSYLTR
jgi:hypothetical protein